MTAFTTDPFLAVPSGAASFTAAVTTSPNPAINPVEPPRGKIIWSLRAPELSATSSMVLICTAIVVISQLICCVPYQSAISLQSSFAHSIIACARLNADCFFLTRLLSFATGDNLGQRGAAHNLFQSPALQLGERPGLLDAHHISGTGQIGRA